MDFRRLREKEKGIIFSILSDSYSDSPLYNSKYIKSWQEYDEFVFSNFKCINNYIVLSVENNEIIGFISWDPRELPNSVRIGHNCIIRKYKGQGKGKIQLLNGIEKIRQMGPERIVVSTGNIPYFIPAQKMYVSCGFQRKAITSNNDQIVPELVNYEMVLQKKYYV